MLALIVGSCTHIRCRTRSSRDHDSKPGNLLMCKHLHHLLGYTSTVISVELPLQLPTADMTQLDDSPDAKDEMGGVGPIQTQLSLRAAKLRAPEISVRKPLRPRSLPPPHHDEAAPLTTTIEIKLTQM